MEKRTHAAITRLACVAGVAALSASPPAAASPATSCRQPWMPTDAPAFCPARTEAALPSPRTYFAVSSSGEHVYVLGGYRFDATTNQLVYHDDVLHARIGADGVISAWTPEPAFQTGRSGLGAVRLGKCLFMNGGSYSTRTGFTYADDTQFAAVAADGKLGPWRTSPNHLKTPRSNHTLLGRETAQGRYLYAVAGVTQIGQDTVHLDTVEIAKVGDDCQIGAWTIASYHLRGGRSTPQALTVRGNLVVIGGWGDLDMVDVYDDVQIAAVRPDATPSPWQLGLGRLPTGLYGHATSYYDPPGTAGSPVLFSVGGQAGTGIYGTWIDYAYVSPAQAVPAAIGRWRIAPSGQLAVGRAGHGIVTFRDRLYVIAGSAPGGQFLQDVISMRFDTGKPLLP
jgi:hypothetical protein